MKTVLVATMGTTPSVLASTVWELAVHPLEFLGEKDSVIPDKIVVFGTARSKIELSKALFQRAFGRGMSTGWQMLCSALEKRGLNVEGKLKFSEGNIYTFRNDAGEEIDDIRNAKDCYCVANAIVKELRDLSVQDDCRILASMSGGRKPESAILLSCMNLLGRERDAVIHLIPVEWPSPTDRCTPPFLFPGQGGFHKTKDLKGCDRKFKSESISFNLINIPFIRVRDCLEDLDSPAPLPPFEELVARSQKEIDKSAIVEKAPFVRFNFDDYSVSLIMPKRKTVIVSLKPTRFAILACDLLLDVEASDVFRLIHKNPKRKNEDRLVGAVRYSPIGNKKDSSNKDDSSASANDFGRQRVRIREDLINKGGLSTRMAEFVGGKGNYRKSAKDPQLYPQNLVSDDDRTKFKEIIRDFLVK